MKVDSRTLVTVSTDRWQVESSDTGDIDILFSIDDGENYSYTTCAEDLDELKQLRDCINKYIQTAEANS